MGGREQPLRVARAPKMFGLGAVKLGQLAAERVRPAELEPDLGSVGAAAGDLPFQHVINADRAVLEAGGQPGEWLGGRLAQGVRRVPIPYGARS